MDEIKIKDYLGSHFSTIEKFHKLLTNEGNIRGLIGPKEVPILWERHILNSSTIVPYINVSRETIDKQAKLVDVGSGAGFPGIVVAAMCPNIQVFLIESMQRRVNWLFHVKQLCELDNVTIIRGRAEDIQKTQEVTSCDFATARAVAPLKRLLGWTMPFLKEGGELLALKGNSAEQEIQESNAERKKWSSKKPEILVGKSIQGIEDTTIVRVVRG